MTKFLRASRFNSFRLAESFFWFTHLSHSSHRLSSIHLLQSLILCGITTSVRNDFFQLKGTLAINLSPLNILKNSFLSKLSETLVNLLKVLF